MKCHERLARTLEGLSCRRVENSVGESQRKCTLGDGIAFVGLRSRVFAGLVSLGLVSQVPNGVR